MKRDRRRIDIVPLWQEHPDARLFAIAVVEMARQRRAEKLQHEVEAKSSEELGDA